MNDDMKSVFLGISFLTVLVWLAFGFGLGLADQTCFRLRNINDLNPGKFAGCVIITGLTYPIFED